MERFKTSKELTEALTLDNSNRVINVLNDDLNNINYNIDVLSVLIYNFKSINYSNRVLALDYIYKLADSGEYEINKRDKEEIIKKIKMYKEKDIIFNDKLKELKDVLNQI